MWFEAGPIWWTPGELKRLRWGLLKLKLFDQCNPWKQACKQREKRVPFVSTKLCRRDSEVIGFHNSASKGPSEAVGWYPVTSQVVFRNDVLTSLFGRLIGARVRWPRGSSFLLKAMPVKISRAGVLHGHQLSKSHRWNYRGTDLVVWSIDTASILKNKKNINNL